VEVLADLVVGHGKGGYEVNVANAEPCDVGPMDTHQAARPAIEGNSLHQR
jgi:hypothetical protein